MTPSEAYNKGLSVLWHIWVLLRDNPKLRDEARAAFYARNADHHPETEHTIRQLGRVADVMGVGEYRDVRR